MALRTFGRKLKPSSHVKLRLPPKVADRELLVPEHLAWAREVKRRAGYRCEDCGAQGREIAGPNGVRIYADHVEERKDGGAKYDRANGCCRCASCHGNKTMRARAARRANDWGRGV